MCKWKTNKGNGIGHKVPINDKWKTTKKDHNFSPAKALASPLLSTAQPQHVFLVFSLKTHVEKIMLNVSSVGRLSDILATCLAHHDI